MQDRPERLWHYIDLLDEQSTGYSKTVSIAPAYPATSCSSRVAKDSISTSESSRSTSRSLSMAPSIQVEEPMLSMVATRRRRESRSGAIRPMACQTPLNSSMSAISRWNRPPFLQNAVHASAR